MKALASFLVAAALAAAGQTVAPAFDAASVKANPARAGVRLHSFPGNRFEATNVPLLQLVLVAFGEPGQMLPESQVTGGPAWIDVDRFDISATVGPAGVNTVAQKQRMLKTLLLDRFKLRTHIETHDMPIFTLTLARKNGALGPQLHHADVDCEPLLGSQPGLRDRCILSASPSGELMLRGQTMAAVANVLTRLLGRAVRDRTGLTGGVDADAVFDPRSLPGMLQLRPDEQRAPSDAPPLATALDEQLGLKLESTRGPVDVLVIDSAERPGDN